MWVEQIHVRAIKCVFSICKYTGITVNGEQIDDEQILPNENNKNEELHTHTQYKRDKVEKKRKKRSICEFG